MPEGKPEEASGETPAGDSDQLPANHEADPLATPLAGQGRVVLRGREEDPIVLGRPKTRLTDREYNVLTALLKAGERGLSKNKLDEKSGHSESRKVLTKLRNSDPDWAEVIHMPGKAGMGGYRIK